MNRLKSSAAALGLSVALASVVATPVLAQVVPMPAVGRPKAVAMPQMEDFQLSNGIKVTFIPYEVVPKAIVYVGIPTGSNADGDKAWLSDFTVSLMREGAGNLSGAQLSEAFADMGGAMSSGVGNDRTNFQTTVLSERVTDAIDLLSTIVRQPTLPQEPVERIRQGMLRSIAIGKSQASGQLSEAYAATLYPNHPYGVVYADPAVVGSFTAEDAKAFYGDHIGPNGVQIYVGGTFNNAATKAALERAFGSWRGNNQPAVAPATAPVARRVVLVNRPNAVQSTFRLAVDVPVLGSPDAIKYEVMDSLLGGAFNSRITTNIREDKGYAYSPGSSIENIDKRTSHWVYDADVTAANTGDALKEIFSEIRRLQSEAPTAAETTGTQNYNAGIYTLGLGSTSGAIGKVIWADRNGLPRSYLDAFVPAAMAVTAQDIQRAAQGLDLSKMTLVVVGDLETVRPQLEALPELQGVTFEVFQP
ncbi:MULTISPECIES: M16 family metallopeptidase [unclassified Brevundimonas]|uniref:M16 family metallopeptidase n=1 Tax=unclassified Brevundimonas TaxID=2622653 RepID=UPI0025B914F6|nr:MULTISPECIES: pitrilysin family protein [unclassified Brevundimonas]